MQIGNRREPRLVSRGPSPWRGWKKEDSASEIEREGKEDSVSKRRRCQSMSFAVH